MTETATDYRETLRVPLAWWLLGMLFAVAVWWAFLVAVPVWGAVLAGAVAAGCVVALLAGYGAAAVSTSPRGLTAGRATLPWHAMGEAEPLDPQGTRRVLGVDADARAYLLLRGYCRRAVRVTVVDPVDPTPYWVVSTRRPEELAAHLRTRSMQD